MTDTPITVRGLGKRYRRYTADRPWTLQEALFRGFRSRGPAQEFWSLREVSFAVKRGSTLAILGRNGSGKSTLLRILGGVLHPDEGSVTVRGRVSGLLDLGAGFHPDLTGRENVFVGSIVAGLTRQETAARFDRIVAFAELESFIDAPFRSYSTGMQMRLAFAVAAHVNPDVLLIDEVLAVGDAGFQRKCIRRLGQLKDDGCTIVMVTHDTGQVPSLCDEALWLRRGRLMSHGPAADVTAQYLSEFEQECLARTPMHAPPATTSGGLPLVVGQNRFGSLEAEITDVQIRNGTSAGSGSFRPGDSLTVEIEFRASAQIANPIFGITITDESGAVYLNANTDVADVAGGLPSVLGRLAVEVSDLHLPPGAYYVNPGIYEAEWSYAFDYHWRVYRIENHGSAVGSGEAAGRSAGARVRWSALDGLCR